MRLYHGTNLSSAFDIWIHGIDINKSLPYLDFGQGFYMTDSKKKAIQRAIKKTNDYNKRYYATEQPYIVEVIIDESALTEYKTKIFKTTDCEWCEFVTNNRFDLKFLKEQNLSNHNKDFKYDIVCGSIADGTITSIISDVKMGKYSLHDINYKKYFPNARPDRDYGYQISLHTREALSCIISISCDIIKNKENTKSKRW